MPKDLASSTNSRWAALTFSPDLSKSGRKEGRRATSLAPEGFERLGDEFCGHRNQRGIRGFRQVIDAGITGKPLHRRALGVHRQDAPGEARFQHRGNWPTANPRYVIGGPDHRNRARGDETIKSFKPLNPVVVEQPGHKVASEPRMAVHWLDRVPPLP